MPEETTHRVAKLIARAGLCSRREAERWIEAGRVALDGKVLKSAAIAIANPARLTVDGRHLPAHQPARLWRYHKPRGLVTTHADPQGRDTIFQKLPVDLPRVISVGRLDLNSEGLLLLTNDGAMARFMELPATGWTRRYRARVKGAVDAKTLARLANGITVEGVRYGPIEAKLDRQQGANAWLTIGLREGKNRELRKVFDHLGWPVSRLIRLAYGPFQLGNLAAGKTAEVPAKVLREQLGQDIAPPPAPRPVQQAQAKNAHRRRPA